MKETIILLIILTVVSCCNTQRNAELLSSPSQYIKNHANDPVNWYIWSDDIWSEAEKENKLVLISIGYFACHWCHVMQNESFKNEEIASIMNKYYYNVKIDREEHPNVDAYYAELQKEMTGWAGWPMHFILTADKKVIWTGIYKKPEDWRILLIDIAHSYKNNSNYVYTKNLITKPEVNTSENINFKQINNYLINKFDSIKGGLKPSRYSRKYPMPFLLKYLQQEYQITGNDTIKKFLLNTADKMYQGGIFDQINGGFFRFSMDENWHIPHFEKMLYTSASMTSFYVEMYKLFDIADYKKCAVKTADFIISELSSETPLFFGSLDADQINEGSYYVYNYNELEQKFKKDFDIVKNYYNIKPELLWQDTSYHIFLSGYDSVFTKQNNLSLNEWLRKKQSITQSLKNLRNKKQKPAKDLKLISSWNALVLKSFIQLYSITYEKKYLQKAKAMVSFFEKKYNKDGRVKHFYLNKEIVNPGTFPEDQLYLADALIELYKYDSNEKYMSFAANLFSHFQENLSEQYQFPKKDLALPSVTAIQNIVSQELNEFYNTNKFKTGTINTIEINNKPEEYGLQLFYLRNSQ